MMPPPLNFHQFIMKFFQPLNKKYRFWTISASVIIGLALYAGVDIGLSELARQNSYDIHMLATEQLNELGPCFFGESGEHAEMIRQYVDHLEGRYLAGILRILYPTLSPQKALTSTRDALEKAKEKEAEETIWQAGLASNQLYMLGKRFPRSPIAWFKSEKLPDSLVRDVNDALSESSELTDKLESAQTLEAAVAACRANRKTILLLFLARLGYDNEEKIRSFLSDVERARDFTLLIAKRMVEDKTNQELLYETARSEDRRVKILEVMLAEDKDMEEACHLLTEAIKIARKRRGEKFPD
jgi:hypothetical protein